MLSFVFVSRGFFFYKRNVLLISYLGYLTGLDLCWCEVVRFQEIDLIKLYVLWNDCFLCFFLHFHIRVDGYPLFFPSLLHYGSLLFPIYFFPNKIWEALQSAWVSRHNR